MTEKRTGVGRRAEDNHCEAHTEQISDIAAIKANNKLLTIILPIILTVGAGFVGYYVQQMDKTMDKLADNLTIVHQAVQTTAIQSALTAQRLEILEATVRGKRP